jgi:hypothetical protein
MSCNATDTETFQFGPHFHSSEATIPGNMYTDVLRKFVLPQAKEEEAEDI